MSGFLFGCQVGSSAGIGSIGIAGRRENYGECLERAGWVAEGRCPRCGTSEVEEVYPIIWTLESLALRMSPPTETSEVWKGVEGTPVFGLEARDGQSSQTPGSPVLTGTFG